MPELRDKLRIIDVGTSKPIHAGLVKLDSQLAAEEIDRRWWSMPPGCDAKEEDGHWLWKKLCDQYANADYWDAVGLKTVDGRLQGAMIYRIDAKSVLATGSGAIYVDRLATAPWNRGTVTQVRLYSGVGSALLQQAVHHSHLLGFQGRVNLTTLAGAVGFYEQFGFMKTGTIIEELELLELPAATARIILCNEGLVPR